MRFVGCRMKRDDLPRCGDVLKLKKKIYACQLAQGHRTKWHRYGDMDIRVKWKAKESP